MLFSKETHHITAKQAQIKLVKHLLDCCWSLYQLRNYNGFGALMSGLNSVSLTRLKYLWEGLSKADAKVKRKRRVEEIV
jgi:lysozyme family protein